MALERLGVENLDQGRFLQQAHDALERAMNDVFARPDLKMAREIKMTIEITPGDQDQTGRLMNVKIAHGVKSSMPALKSSSIGIVDGHDVMVSLWQPDARQMDIADMETERKKRANGADSKK